MHTPDFDRLVVRGSDQSLTVSREAHAAHAGRVCFKHRRLSFAERWRHGSGFGHAWDRDRHLACGTYILGVHNLTVRSLDAEASSSPDGEKCTAVTTSWWPINLNALDLGLRFHIMTVLSFDPVAVVTIKLKKEIKGMVMMNTWCRRYDLILNMSHKCFSLPYIPSCLLLGLKSAHVTASLWPLKCLKSVGSS